MLIRCTAREHDFIVRLGSTKYHFVKNARGDLLCDVPDDDQAAQILADPLFEPFEEAERQSPTDGDDDEAPADGEVTLSAGTAYEGKTREELAALYQQRFGRIAQPHAKYSTLLKRLIETD